MSEAVAAKSRLLRKTKAQLVDELESLKRHNTELVGGVGGSVRSAKLRRVSDGRLALILNSVPAGIAYVDRQQRFRFANQQYEYLLGVPPSELIGRTLKQTLGDKPYRIASKFIRRALAGESVQFDSALPHGDGETITIAVSYVPDLGPEKSVRGFYVLIQETTEQKKVEAALQELRQRVDAQNRKLRQANRRLEKEVAGRTRASARFEALFEAAPDPTISVDANGKMVEINLQAERTFGYRRKELIGQDLEFLVPDRFRRAHVDHRRAYSRDPKTREMGIGMELTVLCKDGRELPIEIGLSPARIGDEGVVIATIRDISGRIEISNALDKTTGRLRRLLESTNAIPWEAKPGDWMFRYVGPRVVELLGYPREQWLKGEFWLEHMHPEDRMKTMARTVQLALQSNHYQLEYRMIAADGRAVWIQDIVNVVKQNGKPELLQGFMIDITERKSLEETRRNLSARLISAQEEERTRISRELHDDFGQRLALLAVEVQRLGQNIPDTDPRTAKSLEELWSHTQKLSTDVQRLSRQLHPAILDQLGLGPAIRSLCSEFAQQHDIDIDLAQHDVPETIAQDISLCLYRTLQEGLRNIVKHSGAKGAKVELTAVPDMIHLCIADRGVGFDPECVKGQGLGLISIEERAGLVGGEMSLQSRPSHGTSIDLRIPLAPPDA